MLRVRAARGFTLLELMIVMVLLAVLGSISLPVYQGYITDTAADTFLAEVAEFERFLGWLCLPCLDVGECHKRGYGDLIPPKIPPFS